MTINQARAYRVYLIFNAASSLAYSMIFTLYNIYVVSTAQLDPLQLVLLGTALELSVFIFEVPTGVVADVFSRPPVDHHRHVRDGAGLHRRRIVSLLRADPAGAGAVGPGLFLSA